MTKLIQQNKRLFGSTIWLYADKLSQDNNYFLDLANPCIIFFIETGTLAYLNIADP